MCLECVIDVSKFRAHFRISPCAWCVVHGVKYSRSHVSAGVIRYPVVVKSWLPQLTLCIGSSVAYVVVSGFGIRPWTKYCSRAGESTRSLLCGCVGGRYLLCGRTLFRASSHKPRVLLLFEIWRDDHCRGIRTTKVFRPPRWWLRHPDTLPQGEDYRPAKLLLTEKIISNGKEWGKSTKKKTRTTKKHK